MLGILLRARAPIIILGFSNRVGNIVAIKPERCATGSALEYTARSNVQYIIKYKPIQRNVWTTAIPVSLTLFYCQIV